MSKIWGSIKIEIPNEMMVINPNGKEYLRHTLTKNMNISKHNKIPSIQFLPSDDVSIKELGIIYKKPQIILKPKVKKDELKNNEEELKKKEEELKKNEEELKKNQLKELEKEFKDLRGDIAAKDFARRFNGRRPFYGKIYTFRLDQYNQLKKIYKELTGEDYSIPLRQPLKEQKKAEKEFFKSHPTQYYNISDLDKLNNKDRKKYLEDVAKIKKEEEEYQLANPSYDFSKLKKKITKEEYEKIFGKIR
jgi:hypothetical protein